MLVMNADSSTAAKKSEPFVNSLGMNFVPVSGTKVLFSAWETRVQDYRAFAQETNREWPKPDFEQGPTHPAVNVTWEDAVAFCVWLSKKEGRAYRLPTDAEWSVAVGLGFERGITPSDKYHPEGRYPWGEAWPPPPQAGNYIQGLAVDNFAETAPVGSFSAGGNGIYDLGGNVWELCEDWYDGKNEYRVARGGSWRAWPDAKSVLLASYRYRVHPTYRDVDLGFRCVLVVPGG